MNNNNNMMDGNDDDKETLRNATYNSDETLSLMEDIVSALSPKVEYVDSLYTNIRGTTISKDSTEEGISEPVVVRGVSFRLFKMGEWREAAFAVLNKEKIMEELQKISDFTPASKHDVKTLVHTKPQKKKVTVVGKKDPRDVSAREKLEVVRHYFQIAKNIDSRIINVDVRYRDVFDERIFTNSEGNELQQVLCRLSFALIPVARENDRIDYDYAVAGGTGGFELFDKIICDEIAAKTAKGSLELLNAHQVPAGTYEVVLDQGMTGTFAHESFGHGCEADQVLRGRSYLVNYLGKKIGPDDFTLYDDGTFEGGHGYIAFDDEGVESHKTPIVKDGYLRNFLQDRITAEQMGVEPTGNARRESYRRPVYVRMTNTYIEPGDWTLEEMLNDIKDGILLGKWNSGIEDPIGGNMQLKSKRSWRIKNGQLAEVYSTTVLSGKVLEFMSKIKGITKPSDFDTDAGYCGKGNEDYVTVGSGGSYLRSTAAVGQG